MSEKKVPVNKSVTSKDVAKLAGVSQASVSRVFSNADGCGVKDSMREKVLAAAKELGYRPNFVARGMSSGKTNIVGLVVGGNLGPFYNSIINSFVKKIQEIGKQCLVFKVPRQEQLDQIVERVIQFHVDAVIITASAMTKDMAETIVDNDIPIVLFNRFIPGINVSTVYVDPVEGAGAVAEYLHEKGHRNIGYIHFTEETGEELEKRIGFYSKLRQYGIYQLQEESSGYVYEEGYQAGRKLLSSENPPSAIFCTSDLIAMGVMDAARHEFGFSIPEDLAVVGYDDIPMASWKAYDLTTVRQPIDEMIYETIHIIKSLIDHKEDVSIKMIKPVLIERSTV